MVAWVVQQQVLWGCPFVWGTRGSGITCQTQSVQMGGEAGVFNWESGDGIYLALSAYALIYTLLCMVLS